MEIGRITKIGRDGELFAGDSAQGSRGKGDRTISNAEVSIPLSPGRWVLIGGICCPIPLTPWLAAPRVVAARKKEAFASLGVSTSFLLPYTEHPPQDGGKDGGRAQNDDLHEDTFLSIYVGLSDVGEAGTASICHSSQAGENTRKICRGQLTQVPFCGIL